MSQNTYFETFVLLAYKGISALSEVLFMFNRYKLFLSFCNQLKTEIHEKYPELNDQEQKAYFDLLMSRVLLAPLQAVGSVSEFCKCMNQEYMLKSTK